MAKGIGLIGNFRGKVGNMVGYNLKDSNNKQTQGVRVYQPIVKNPKTYGQAEQRAKLAPINATYRALKMIIDRGQEGKTYGNKSRLAWLSVALKAFNGGWFEKGAAMTLPAIVPISKGSLGGVTPSLITATEITLNYTQVGGQDPQTIKALSEVLIAQYPQLKSGDQLTFVMVKANNGTFEASVKSLELDTTDTSALPSWIAPDQGDMLFKFTDFGAVAGSVIVSREGDNGSHLRSTASLIIADAVSTDPMTPAAKDAAVKSYMAAGANTDWAEESIQ